MEGKTHRIGGALCCLGGYSLLSKNGMLLGDVNPLLQLVIMYPFAIYGSVLPDLDHAWESCPCKDIASYGVNKVLHLTTPIAKATGNDSFPLSLFNARHRSWQTHSDLSLIALVMLSNWLLNSSVTTADLAILRLISCGLILGVVSHLVLDILTPEGVWSTVKILISTCTKYKKVSKKFSVVPNTPFFRTGGSWELIIRKILWVMCIIFAINIVLSFSSYELVMYDFLGG